MSNPSALLQSYMDDNPNLITQPGDTENDVNGIPRDDILPSQNNMGIITNATPGPTTLVPDGREEDMEMADPPGERGEAMTGIGTLLRRGALIPATWFALRSDSESRKRKDRSPSPEVATDGAGQSIDNAGAHKKLRASSEPQGAETGVATRRDSPAGPSRSESEAPGQSSSAQSMPGALSSTTMGPSSSQSMASAPVIPSLTADGPFAAVTTGHTLAVTNNTSPSEVSHAGVTSGATGPSRGHGSSAPTNTPPGSPPEAITNAGPSRPSGNNQTIPVKDKTSSCDPPPSIDPLSKRLTITSPGAPAVHGPGGEASTGGSVFPPVVPATSSAGASSASSSTTPNNPDPWLVLAAKFDGVRTEMQTMGTHMRAMNNNLGRLDNAMGVMADQHTELMAALRTAFRQPFNPPPPAGHPSGPTGQRPVVSATAHSTVPVGHQPPGATLPRPAATRQQFHAAPSSHSATQSRHIAPPPSSSSRKNSSRAQVPSDDEMDVDGGELGDMEGEIPEPLPVLVKSSKLKLKGMPRPRDPVRKALLDDIKLMARRYMGREVDPDDDDDDDDDDDRGVPFFDDAKVPSRDEVAAFNGRGEHCCTIDNFRPDLLGTPRSTWNQSVAQVFAKEYIKTATAKSKNATEVARAFGDHMKTLINSYKAFQASDTTNDAKRRTRRRYMRKSYAHQRRMMTVAAHDGMKHHLWVIQALGVQGMSSDESEHEGTEVRYRRTTLQWRNPTLETFFHTIDVFHGASRFTDGVDKSSKSGSHVHVRLPARNTSKRAAVPGLPEAAYNPEWLKDLSDFFRNRLNISNVQYQFAHSSEVMKEMMQVQKPTASEQTQQIPPQN